VSTAGQLVDENNNTVDETTQQAIRFADNNNQQATDESNSRGTSTSHTNTSQQSDLNQVHLEPTICCNCISEPSLEDWVSEEDEEEQEATSLLLPMEQMPREDIEMLVDIYLLIEKTRWLLHSVLW
jgi:hypothetical protein